MLEKILSGMFWQMLGSEVVIWRKKKSLEPIYFEGCAKNPSKDVFPSVLF